LLKKTRLSFLNVKWRSPPAKLIVQRIATAIIHQRYLTTQLANDVSKLFISFLRETFWTQIFTDMR